MPLRLAELHDVPNDQKIAFETELADQLELVLHLVFCALHQAAIVFRSVARADAFGNALAQENSSMVSPSGTG